MADDNLTKVKLLLSISDALQDNLIKLLLEDSEARLLSYINQDGAELATYPQEMSWLLREVAIRRFNRIGDEGKKSSSESDVTATWADDDVADYAVYLKRYRNKKGGGGIARFV